MKRALSLIFVLALSVFMFGFDWHTANQTTVGWNAVEVSTGTVEYVVYLANAVTDPDKANPVEVGKTAELQHTVTLNTDGRYFIGVQSTTVVDGETVAKAQAVSWSDDPAVTQDGVIFGVQYFKVPAVTGLRPIE